MLEIYQSLYPGYVINWTNMVETMGRTDTPKERIENLLCVKQIHFPEQPIDWEYLLNDFMRQSNVCFQSIFTERMQLLVTCGMSESVESIPFKVWRDHITKMIKTSKFEYNRDNLVILREIRAKLASFGGELIQLKEATTILELALWKMKMNEKKSNQDIATQSQKRIKTGESITRQQCHVTCGADVVIGPVLQFLIATGDEIYDYDTEIEEG